jgi:hypothetical protein
VSHRGGPGQAAAKKKVYIDNTYDELMIFLEIVLFLQLDQNSMLVYIFFNLA